MLASVLEKRFNVVFEVCLLTHHIGSRRRDPSLTDKRRGEIVKLSQCALGFTMKW